MAEVIIEDLEHFKKEYARKNRDYDYAERQYLLYRASAPHRSDGLAFLQKRDNIEHRDHSDASQNVWDIQPFVFAYPVKCKFWIKCAFHCLSPPVARSVSVSEIF